MNQIMDEHDQLPLEISPLKEQDLRLIDVMNSEPETLKLMNLVGISSKQTSVIHLRSPSQVCL